MFATRLVALAANQSSRYTRVIPPETFLNKCTTFVNGVYNAIQTDTQYFQTLIDKEIIRVDVLERAKHGTYIVYSLFENLRNPALKQSDFDMNEFIQTVQPALQVYYENLVELGKQLPTLLENEIKDAVSTKRIKLDLNLSEPNLWLEQANKHPDSIAARVSKMTTENCFNSIFSTARTICLFGALTKAPAIETCEVGEVALLKARVLVMDQEESLIPKNSYVIEKENTDTKDVDIDNNDELEKEYQPQHVVAQFEFVYELSQSSIDPYNKQEMTIHTIMNVAVIEGWLKGGPDNTLQWKIADIRNAREFAYKPSTIVRSR